MCPSSGELTVSLRHWYFPFCMGGCLVCGPDSHSYEKDQQKQFWKELNGNSSGPQTRQPPIQNGKYQCRRDTVSSPDDGHIIARNMYRS